MPRNDKPLPTLVDPTRKLSRLTTNLGEVVLVVLVAALGAVVVVVVVVAVVVVVVVAGTEATVA